MALAGAGVGFGASADGFGVSGCALGFSCDAGFGGADFGDDVVVGPVASPAGFAAAGVALRSGFAAFAGSGRVARAIAAVSAALLAPVAPGVGRFDGVSARPLAALSLLFLSFPSAVIAFFPNSRVADPAPHGLPDQIEANRHGEMAARDSGSDGATR